MHNLITVLTISVDKHGADTPLTLGHLLNLCKMVEKIERKQDEQEIYEHHKLLNESNPLGQG